MVRFIGQDTSCVKNVWYEMWMDDANVKLLVMDLLQELEALNYLCYAEVFPPASLYPLILP